MYEKVFHFSSRPFTATPYVKHYFSGESIDQALGQAKNCIDRASGPVTAVGNAGTGKSLLLAMLEEHYRSEFNVVNLACANLEKRQDLLQSILFELKRPYQGLTDSELRFSLIEYLGPSEQCVNGILLLIDEAHLMSIEMLDEVRLITNFIRDGQPRVRLVLAGDYRLEEKLAEPKLESFNQRIAARSYLCNMNREETARYVVEHIDRAGGEGLQIFNEASLKAIHEVSDGCPRLVNQVCDHALILAATRGELVITDDCVNEAWSDVQNIPGDWAAPATESGSVANLEDDESWTVIEFGQLEDSDTETDNGKSHELANSNPPIDEIDHGHGDDQDATDASGASEEPESEWPAADQPMDLNVDEPIGDDTNRQDWNPTGLDEHPLAQSDAEATVEFSELEDSSEPELTELVSGFESTPIPSESPEVTYGVDDNKSEHAEDSLSNDVDDMEEQLNAVFGEESASTEFSHEKDISEMESEQRSLLDQVESATEESDSSGVNPLASEQLAAAISGFTAQQSEPDRYSFLSPESDREIENAAGDEGSDSHTDDEHAMQLESELILPVSNLENPDLVDVSSPDPNESLESHEPERLADTSDPFAEEFAEEEHLIDRYAPFVAHQNQSSLTITSGHLEMIRPLELETEAEAGSDCSEPEGIAPVDPAASRPPEVPIAILENSEAFEAPVFGEPSDPVNPTEENGSADAAPTLGPLENSDHESPLASPGVYVIQADGSDEAENLSTESDHSNSVDDSVLNSVSQDSSNSLVQHEMVPADGEPTTQSQAADPSGTAEIEQQAEVILKRLGISQDVSCETEDSDSTHLNSADSQEDATPPQTPVVIPQPQTSFPRQPAEASEFDRQNAALDETQQILDEILAQKNLLANKNVESTIDEPSKPPGEPSIPQDSVRIENSEPDDASAEHVEKRRDDRDIIIVNRMDQRSNTRPANEEPVVFPKPPISKGRAERMDYQKLFDQLRDISTSHQS